MNPKLAVIQFPGSNCEYETAFSANYYGFHTEIIRWNSEPDYLKTFDAFILPGGFSFQDRVRAGVIASRLPIMEHLIEASKQGKAVLGICNGCQILVEVGLVPNINNDFRIQAGLTYNLKQGKSVGFVCDWVFVRVQNPKKSVFTKYFSDKDIIPIPINHAEGRFALDNELIKKRSQLTTLSYCNESGEIKTGFCPNGSSFELAAMCNQEGNVMAIMPHPERGMFLKQIPFWIRSQWSLDKEAGFRDKSDSEGPWGKLLVSLKDSIKT
ncbi:phosphoribosylformylglycinamidine synthase I [Thermoproteota archaeon]